MNDNAMPNDINADEKKAIAALKRVAKIWPKTLWLFSASGSLHVMKTDENGERVHLPDDGMDPDFVVDTINISNDGGDW
jgi:hypothetical protein